MAPVAGRIAYAHEDELVLRPGFGKCFISPFMPVNRVVCVLKEVRAGRMYEAVGMFVFVGGHGANLHHRALVLEREVPDLGILYGVLPA
jgi:hypothetical protein